MATATKPGSQLRAEFCIVARRALRRVDGEVVGAGISVKDKMAPKSIEIEAADLIPQW